MNNHTGSGNTGVFSRNFREKMEGTLRLISLIILCVLLIPKYILASAIEQITPPISIEKIEKYFLENPDLKIETFLAALPPALTEHFVLMHKTKSMHLSSPENPRQIMFGSDARFLMALSGIAHDPLYNSIEVIELNSGSGEWDFASLNFTANGPSVERNPEPCANCHGSPSKPIWDQYPNWEGAYGNAKGIVDVSVSAGFKFFNQNVSRTERYRHLKIKPTKNENLFLLPTRFYAYPNTNFNHELGNAVAIGTTLRIKQKNEFTQYSPLVLGSNSAISCIETNEWFDISARVQSLYKKIADQFPTTKRIDHMALRLLGVDPLLEFSLEKTTNIPGSGGSWQTGAYRLEEAFALQLLVETIKKSEPIRELLKNELAKIDVLWNYSQLTGEERHLALQKSSSWFLFYEVFDSIIRDKKKHSQLCSLLYQMSNE